MHRAADRADGDRRRESTYTGPRMNGTARWIHGLLAALTVLAPLPDSLASAAPPPSSVPPAAPSAACCAPAGAVCCCCEPQDAAVPESEARLERDECPCAGDSDAPYRSPAPPATAPVSGAAKPTAAADLPPPSVADPVAPPLTAAPRDDGQPPPASRPLPLLHCTLLF
jgi:pilus assembly protein FimV